MAENEHKQCICQDAIERLNDIEAETGVIRKETSDMWRLLHDIRDFLTVAVEFDAAAAIASGKRFSIEHARVLLVVEEVLEVKRTVQKYALRSYIILIGIIGLLISILGAILHYQSNAVSIGGALLGNGG